MFIELTRVDRLNNTTYPVYVNVDTIEAIEPDLENFGRCTITGKNVFYEIDGTYEDIKNRIAYVIHSQQNQSL